MVNEYGLLFNEITFIHEWTDHKKPELFRKMSNGQIRVLIGSTEKAGTGLNVQQRVVAMHHLDIPWKPSELEQRNGRGARQGNVIAKNFYGNEVHNYIYAVEQSLDNYKFNLLKNKQTFISQMKNCELNVRTIDEGAIDEKSGMNFSEYIAILSGDTSLLEKSKVEKKIAVLESMKLVHFKEITRSRYRLERLVDERKSVHHILSELQSDETKYKSVLTYEKDGSKSNPVQLHGVNSADSEVIGRHIIELYETWKPPVGVTEKNIGSLYGFDLHIKQQQETYQNGDLFEYRHHNSFYIQSKEAGIKYTYNKGHPPADNPKLAARHFLNALDRVGKIKEQYDAELKELDNNIPVLEKLVTRTFEKDEELKLLKTDLSRLEREITIKIKESQLLEEKTEETIQMKAAPVIEMEPKKNRKQKLKM